MKKKKFKIGIGILALILLVCFSFYHFRRSSALSYFETTYKKQIDCLIEMVKNPALQNQIEYYKQNKPLFDSSEFILADVEIDYSTGPKLVGTGKFKFDETVLLTELETSITSDLIVFFESKMENASIYRGHCRKTVGPPIYVLWYQTFQLDPKGIPRSINLIIDAESLKKRDPQAPF